MLIGAQDDRADRIALQIERQAIGIARKFNHLALHHITQAMQPGDAIGKTHDRALGAGLGVELQPLDFLLNQITDFSRADRHKFSSV